jgi:hypothetical protein
VWSDDFPVRKQLASVLEQHDAVAEETPPLFWVASDGACGLTVTRRRGGTWRLMLAHPRASGLNYWVDVRCVSSSETLSSVLWFTSRRHSTAGRFSSWPLRLPVLTGDTDHFTAYRSTLASITAKEELLVHSATLFEFP